MFSYQLRKHAKEICFSAHIGYLIDYKTLMVTLSVYKYSLELEWSKHV